MTHCLVPPLSFLKGTHGSLFIIAFSIDRISKSACFDDLKCLFLKDIVFIGQYINSLPRIFCFFIAMFRIVRLINQEKLLARSLFVNYFDFPGSASRYTCNERHN